jgi:hypothetical protein
VQEKRFCIEPLSFLRKKNCSVQNLFFLRRTIFSTPEPFLGGSVFYPSAEPFYSGEGFCRTPFFQSTALANGSVVAEHFNIPTKLPRLFELIQKQTHPFIYSKLIEQYSASLTQYFYHVHEELLIV